MRPIVIKTSAAQVLPEWISAKDAAVMTGLSAKTVISLGMAGEIGMSAIGRRRLLEVASIRRYIESHRCSTSLSLVNSRQESAL